MLLTGTYPRSVDAKKRLSIPKPIREQLGKPTPRLLYIAPGSYRSLWIFTAEQLERFGDRLWERRENHSELAAYRRLYFAGAEAVELDKQGRILIPDRLVEHAGLGREVVLIGVFDHLELWDQGRWFEYSQEHDLRFDATAEGAIHA
jgi:MraZ protein